MNVTDHEKTLAMTVAHERTTSIHRGTLGLIWAKYGTKIETSLAIILQMPMAVAENKVGKTNALEIYTRLNAPMTPNFTMIIIGQV